MFTKSSIIASHGELMAMRPRPARDTKSLCFWELFYRPTALSTHFIEILGQIFENLGTNPQKFLCLGLLHEILRVVGKPVYFSQGRRCGRWPGITKNDL